MSSANQQGELNKIRNLPMVFIVGCGRSGTTLLQSLLNSHPNIVATPECFFIVMLYPHFGKIKKWKEKDVLEFVEAVYTIQSFALWLLDKQKLIEELLSIIEFANYSLVCKTILYQMRKDKEEVLVLIDKNPANSLFLKKLLHIFPESKFIHLVREPKDCVNAHIKRFNKKNTFFIARYWVGFNDAIEKVKQELPERFFTMLYEDFVRNAEQTMVKLCSFLNVPFDNKIMQNQFPEMLPLYKENKTFERIKIVHEGLLSPINDSNIGKWKKDMDEHDVSITEAITANYALSKYGYTKEHGNRVAIPYFRLLKSKIQYNMWQYFTKLRFATYAFNMYYRKRKSKEGTEKNLS